MYVTNEQLCKGSLGQEKLLKVTATVEWMFKKKNHKKNENYV